MKLDINRAWTDALNLIQTNSGVVAIVAGVFFFLPYFALVLLMPDMAQSMAFEPNSDDPSVVMDQIMALYADVWWAMVLSSIIGHHKSRSRAPIRSLSFVIIPTKKLV